MASARRFPEKGWAGAGWNVQEKAGWCHTLMPCSVQVTSLSFMPVNRVGSGNSRGVGIQDLVSPRCVLCPHEFSWADFAFLIGCPWIALTLLDDSIL